MSDLNKTIPLEEETEVSLDDNNVVSDHDGVVDKRESDGNFKRSLKSKKSSQIKATEDTVGNPTAQ